MRKLCGPIDDELAAPEYMECLNSPCGRIYPTEAIKNIEMVSLAVVGSSEDLLLNLDAFASIENAVYINKAYYHYRKTNESSITSVYKAELAKKWKVLYSMIADIIDREELGDIYHKALSNRIAMSTLGAGLNCVSDKARFGEKYGRVKELINEEQRRDALKQLSLKNMPIHWKAFYFCAKKRLVLLTTLLLQAINYLKRKV